MLTKKILIGLLVPLLCLGFVGAVMAYDDETSYVLIGKTFFPTATHRDYRDSKHASRIVTCDGAPC